MGRSLNNSRDRISSMRGRDFVEVADTNDDDRINDHLDGFCGHLDKELADIRKDQRLARKENKVELTDGQLKVLIELSREHRGYHHVYALHAALKKQYPQQRVLSETAVSNALKRLSQLAILEPEPVLRPSAVGPARQEYRISDAMRASEIINAELDRRDRAVRTFRGALDNRRLQV